MINWLQEWYTNNCDGEWEHDYGVQIKTLDNPGWLVTIDLYGTELEGLEIPYSLNEISDEIWIGYSIINNVFKGVGTSGELNKIIEIFKTINDTHGEKNK